jgi:hypothetical protein
MIETAQLETKIPMIAKPIMPKLSFSEPGPNVNPREQGVHENNSPLRASRYNRNRSPKEIICRICLCHSRPLGFRFRFCQDEQSRVGCAGSKGRLRSDSYRFLGPPSLPQVAESFISDEGHGVKFHFRED